MPESVGLAKHTSALAGHQLSRALILPMSACSKEEAGSETWHLLFSQPTAGYLGVTRHMHAQKGEAPEATAAAKRELEIKRASAASKGTKVFYKVTVKVCSGV